MAQTGTARFTCSGCGRTYRWKLELAGKKVKCGCGHVMIAPEPTAETVDLPEEEDGLYDLAPDAESKPKARHKLPESGSDCPACGQALVQGAILCVQCGYDLQSGKTINSDAIKTKASLRTEPKTPVAPSHTRAAGGPVVGYQSSATRPATISVIEGSPAKDFYIPIALVLIGTIVEFVYVLKYAGDSQLAIKLASAYVGLDLCVNVVVMFVGCLIAAKIADMGFGHPLQAVLKLAAIAISVPAISDLVAGLTGVSYAGWAIAFLVYFILFIWLFDLDGSEARILVAIIWGINVVKNIFLVGLLYSLIFR
ncbi:MAG TPA: hypothetical protein VHD56_03900 [Tepidisphaeraceae bacterium]|nr:hypothetical protein [Tepidisphaeraceae bacterium]